MQTPVFVDFETPDGLTLPGLLYEAPGSKKAMIFLHGNGSSSVFNDEKEYRDLPEALIKKGVSLLKFNNRGAGIIQKLNIRNNGVEVSRKPYGMAFELIRECVPDINGAISFLQNLGYEEFYLMGVSTGANKICVYDHYQPENPISKYVLVCGGDDTGIYHDELGHDKFIRLLDEATKKISDGEGEEIISEILDTELFSYQGFFDIANPDGDYNTFPYSEAFMGVKLSKEPLFRYYSGIKKPSIAIYGENDEYSWGQATKVVETLKGYQPGFTYNLIKDTDHKFTGKQKELAQIIADWI